MQDEIIPLIVQDAETRQVLSLFYCNKESLKLAKKTGFLWRYSRRQRKVVQKGATSGNVQKVIELKTDCDNDAVLAVVKQEGRGACHLNRRSCFSKDKQRSWGALDELCKVIAERKKNPRAKSYTSMLMRNPLMLAAKLKEEAGELSEAMLEKSDADMEWEAADLLYFTLVALEKRGIDPEKVLIELKRRRKA